MAKQAKELHWTLQPGQKVVIHDGSGGVGAYATQLTKHLRAPLTKTTGASNIEWFRDPCCRHSHRLPTQEFETVAHDYDLILDSQGETHWPTRP